MSMYNMMTGEPKSTAAPMILLAVLGLYPDKVPRFRDAWVDDAGNICVFTRMGGGNRGHWDHPDSAGGVDCECPGCRAQYGLAGHPLYLRDYDDDYDCTYATYVFRCPDEYQDKILPLRTSRLKGGEAMRAAIAVLQGDDTPERQAMLERAQPLMDQFKVILGDPEEKTDD